MHDPLVVAFEIRRPWPSRSHMPHPPEPRWSVGKYKNRPWWRPRSYSPFWVIAGRTYYFPSVITVWHREPGGRDMGEVCKHWRTVNGKRVPLGSWRWHVHHWKIQVSPLQALRRHLLTRCAWCGGPSRKGSYVNCSMQWDGPRGRWWQGEPNLFHSDCSSIATAHRTCTCDDPIKDPSKKYRNECGVCKRFIPWRQEASARAANRLAQAIPAGQKPTTEQYAELTEAWSRFRAERDAIEAAEQVIEKAPR